MFQFLQESCGDFCLGGVAPPPPGAPRHGEEICKLEEGEENGEQSSRLEGGEVSQHQESPGEWPSPAIRESASSLGVQAATVFLGKLKAVTSGDTRLWRHFGLPSLRGTFPNPVILEAISLSGVDTSGVYTGGVEPRDRWRAGPPDLWSRLLASIGRMAEMPLDHVAFQAALMTCHEAVDLYSLLAPSDTGIFKEDRDLARLLAASRQPPTDATSADDHVIYGRGRAWELRDMGGKDSLEVIPLKEPSTPRRLAGALTEQGTPRRLACAGSRGVLLGGVMAKKSQPSENGEVKAPFKAVLRCEPTLKLRFVLSSMVGLAMAAVALVSLTGAASVGYVIASASSFASIVISGLLGVTAGETGWCATILLAGDPLGVLVSCGKVVRHRVLYILVARSLMTTVIFISVVSEGSLEALVGLSASLPLILAALGATSQHDGPIIRTIVTVTTGFVDGAVVFYSALSSQSVIVQALSVVPALRAFGSAWYGGSILEGVLYGGRGRGARWDKRQVPRLLSDGVLANLNLRIDRPVGLFQVNAIGGSRGTGKLVVRGGEVLADGVDSYSCEPGMSDPDGWLVALAVDRGPSCSYWGTSRPVSDPSLWATDLCIISQAVVPIM